MTGQLRCSPTSSPIRKWRQVGRHVFPIFLIGRKGAGEASVVGTKLGEGNWSREEEENE